MMQFIDTGTLTIHYQQTGQQQKPALVFINSLGTDLRIWDEVIPGLSSDYHIIRYDKRGHGLSDCPPAPYSIRDHADDLAKLLNALKVESAVLVGISVGGLIAIDFAITHPTQIKGLVLCDTAPKTGTPEMWNERIAVIREQGMNHLAPMVLKRWFAPAFAERNPAAYQGYNNLLSRSPAEGYIGTCTALRDADLTEALKSLQMPALVLCGAEDVSTPPDLVRGIVNLMPNARFGLIENAGHLPCIEQPAIVSADIQQFLKVIHYG